MSAPDARAVKTLLRTYWSSAGWREEPASPPEDLAHAVEAGVMFADPLTVARDDIVAGVVEAADQVSARNVADAFLASLTSRRLDLRSALGSYAVARHLTPHDFEPGPSHVSGHCAVCRASRVAQNVDRNVLNFERFKWGGVRRDDLTYVSLDLQQFATAEPQRPTVQDRATFEDLLSELETAPPTTTAPQAAQKMMRGIKGNKQERAVLLDIMGVCSVLETPAHRGYADRFVRAEARVLPPLRFVEHAYPTCWWKAEHGVNRRAARSFGLL